MDVKVGIHQPNFLPWLGYFIKMNASDVFICHDDVEYSKSSLTRRTYIRKSSDVCERKYLIVPLQKHSDFAKISELIIADKDKTVRDILNHLSSIYSNAPFYKQLHGDLEVAFQEAFALETFSDTSIFLLQYLREVLNITTPMYRSTQLLSFGKQSIYNIQLVKEVGGTIYLSGQGAKKYQDENLFNKEDIDLHYLEPMPYLCTLKEKYPQFNPGYSVLDALYYIGQEKVSQLIQDYQL